MPNMEQLAVDWMTTRIPNHFAIFQMPTPPEEEAESSTATTMAPPNPPSSSSMASSNTTTTTDYTDAQFDTMFALNCFELLGHLLLDCPVSALNFYLILQTAILHPNLKFILLCQSICIFVRGIARMSLNWMRLLVDMETYGPMLLAIAYTFPVFARNYLAHVLVIERVMATIFVRTYEHWRKPYFSIVWFAIVMTLTSLQVLIIKDANFRYGMVVGTAMLVLLEMVVFTWIWKYNDGIYNRIFFQMHSLSQRYQLSENIRTGKQLMPTLALYFINIAIDTLVVTFGQFQMLGPVRFNYTFIVQIAYCIGTVVNFLIELSMLIFHPFLRRDFYRLWRSIVKKCGSSRTTVVPSSSIDGQHPPPRRESGLALRNMRGQKMVLNRAEEAEGHFRHLDNAWGVAGPKPKFSL